jgi:hypothetical protein
LKYSATIYRKEPELSDAMLAENGNHERGMPELGIDSEIPVRIALNQETAVL